MKTTNYLCLRTAKLAIILCLLFICSSVSAQKEAFKGKWNGEKDGVAVEINMDLSQQFIEDIYDMDGAFCYGRITAMQNDQEYACYSIIDAEVNGNKAVLQLNTMDSPDITITLIIQDKQMAMSWVKKESDNIPMGDGQNYLPVGMELKREGDAVEVATTQMPEGTVAADTMPEKAPSQPLNWSYVIALFVLLILTAHAFVVSRKKSSVQLYDPAYFIHDRKARGLEAECSDADHQKVDQLLNEIAQKLTPIVLEDGSETLAIETKKQHDMALAKYKEALALAPTDEMTVMGELNGMALVIQDSEEREFDGSIKVMVVAAIVSVLVGFMMGDVLIAFMFLMCTALYYFSNFVSGYIICNRVLRNKGSLGTGLFSMISSMITGAKSYKITIRRKDNGEKLAEGNDNTEVHMALFTSLIILFMVGMCISYFAIWAYAKHVILKR